MFLGDGSHCVLRLSSQSPLTEWAEVMLSVLLTSVIRHGGLGCLSAFSLHVRRVSPPLPVVAHFVFDVVTGGCAALRTFIWKSGQFQSWHGRRFSFLTTGSPVRRLGHVRLCKER